MKMKLRDNDVMRYYSILAVLLAVLRSLSCEGEADLVFAKRYLEKYQYLTPAQGGKLTSQLAQAAVLMDMTELRSAIAEFQRYARLNVTGILDMDTLTLMLKPRCGNSDAGDGLGGPRRGRRFVVQGSKWERAEVTYRVNVYPPTLSRHDVDRVVYTAFKHWSDITELTFTRVTRPFQPADINLGFWRGPHGDALPFDGRLGTLAHAFYPAFGGDVHLDKDEVWTDGTTNGTNLLQVLTHELGHTLGLGHSDDMTAVMAPFYFGYSPIFSLREDDVAAAQHLYGPRVSPTMPPFDVPPATDQTSPPVVKPPNDGGPSEKPSPPEYCLDASIDAITMTDGTVIHVFMGENYLVLESGGVAPGYPRLAGLDWPGLAGTVDAVLTTPPRTIKQTNLSGQLVDVVTRAETVFIFQGASVHVYSASRVPQPGNPRPLEELFPGVPSDVEAAFMWAGRVQFVKDSQYYTFTLDASLAPSEGRLETPTPRPMSDWRYVSHRVTAAFTASDGKVYMFTGGGGSVYYAIHSKYQQVSLSFPPYPRPAALWWLGCHLYMVDGDPSLDRANTVTSNNGKISVLEEGVFANQDVVPIKKSAIQPNTQPTNKPIPVPSNQPNIHQRLPSGNLVNQQHGQGDIQPDIQPDSPHTVQGSRLSNRPSSSLSNRQLIGEADNVTNNEPAIGTSGRSLGGSALGGTSLRRTGQVSNIKTDRLYGQVPVAYSRGVVTKGWTLGIGMIVVATMVQVIVREHIPVVTGTL